MDPATTEPAAQPSNFTAAAPAQKSPPAAPRALISDQLRHPAWLCLVSTLPLTLLFLSSKYTYSIITGELNAAARWDCADEAVILLVLIALSVVMAVRGMLRGRLITPVESGITLLISIAAMILGIVFSIYTIPGSIPAWIVPRDEVLYQSLCLGMPGAFYALVLLASSPVRRSTGLEFVQALGIAVGTVLGTFLVSYVFSTLARGLDFPEWFGMTLLFVLTFAGGTLVSGAVIRMTLLTYTSVRRWPTYLQQGFMFLIALVGPLGGLALNRTIPFPVDFQAPMIYLLTVVNGVVLLFPPTRSIWRHRVIWTAQCIMFPFSAYFLIVFLPWLPFSPFAMIAVGSGFLMLVPLVLGTVHGYRIADGYRAEIRDGSWWKPAVCGLAAILVLPAALGWSMWQDRRTLDQALDYVYCPDYRKDIAFPGDLGRLQGTLQHLRDMKHGIYLPFISPLYNSIVFHDLVLPDAKIETLQQAFFGTPATEKASPLLRSMSDWGDGEDSGGAPPTNVALQDVQVTATKDGPVTTSHLTVTMQNRSDAESEFVTTIHIPEGVYVSNFGLVINNQLVPARVVEKKTALWVYEKISVVQRDDPGLLIYKSRTELEMRVFPFEKDQIRTAEIELVHPNAAPLSVTIGDRTVELNRGAPTQTSVVTSCTTTSGSMAVAEGADVAGLAIHRTPYLDILIDCSTGWGYSRETIAESLRQARQAYPDAKLARVTALNYEARDIISDLIPVDQLDAAVIQSHLLPSRGGFLEDRFLKRGLLQAYDLMQQSTSNALLRPQFVIITGKGQPAALHEGNLESFLHLVPDARVIYAQDPGRGWQTEDMASHTPTNPPLTNDVILWQWAGHYAASPADTRAVATFPSRAVLAGAPRLYQAATGQFAPIATALVADAASRLADGVRTWAAQDEATQNPSLLQNGAAALIGLSKQTRILIPDSSFIAVESAAQWRIMEEKEKQKLANKQVFELEEPVSAPEPSTWVLLLTGVAVLWLRSRRASRRKV